MEQSFSLKRLFITIAIVVLAAGAVGGGTWYVMDQQAKKDAEEYQKQIAEVEKQKEGLESKNAVKAAEKTIRDFDLRALTGEKTSLGSFRATEYKDLTGDGKEEALVVFTYSGSGSIKDFFVYGVSGSKATLLLSRKSLNQGQISIKAVRAGELPVIAVTWVDPGDPLNAGKPNSDMTVTENTSKQYKWNGTTFVESYLQ